jgi:hypothetical protein
VVAAAGCAKTRAPAEQRPVPAASSQAASAPSTAAPAPSATRARPMGDGCHSGAGAAGGAEARRAAVAEACAPGSRALGEAKTFTGGGELGISAGHSSCIRVIAVAERLDVDVGLELRDASGTVRARDALPGSVALAGEKGPVCFGAATELVAKVTAPGAVAVSAHLMQ